MHAAGVDGSGSGGIAEEVSSSEGWLNGRESAGRGMSCRSLKSKVVRQT